MNKSHAYHFLLFDGVPPIAIEVGLYGLLRAACDPSRMLGRIQLLPLLVSSQTTQPFQHHDSNVIADSILNLMN